MFDITSIFLKDFKSFSGEHTFDLPTEPGLYFLTGINKAEPKLGSNGAGKSTLLDAIYWCLFGRTLRGLKASDVVSWGARNCTVAVTLTLPTGNLQVTRGQNPNILAVDDDDHCIVTQEELDKRLGLTAGAFVYSVILPQFGQSFFELKPAEKLTLFSQILNLDFWLEKSEKAAEAARATSNAIDKTVYEIESSKDLIVSNNTGIESLLHKQRSFEKERTHAIHATKEMKQMLDDEIEIIGTKLAKLNTSRQFWEKDLERRAVELEQLKATAAKYVSRYDGFDKERAVLNAKIKDIRMTLSKLFTLGATCPTCKQIVDSKHLKDEQKKLSDSIAIREAEVTALEKQLKETKRFIIKADGDFKSYAEGTDDVTNERNDAKTKMAVLTQRLKDVHLRQSELDDRIKAKTKEENPYTDLLAQRNELLDQLNKKIKDYQARLGNLNAEHEATVYWVTGFKRVRLFIIEETLRTLELEVNNALGSLGLVDWSIEFDVERENKSGGVTKGFVVLIRCPSNPEPVRFESWSGGETQRLQLAGDFGLANLIMQQAGLANTIEFFDEPSDHLSDEGLLDLAETLQQRALNDKKRIFLVDHRMPDFGDFAGVVTVVKDKNGSRIKNAP